MHRETFHKTDRRILRGMGQNEVRRKREKRESGRGKKEQETRSHKQNSKFREAGTLLLKIWTFSKNPCFFDDFVKKKKTLLLRSKIQLLICFLFFFWTDRFREKFLVHVTPISGSRPTARSSGHWTHGCSYYYVKFYNV